MNKEEFWNMLKTPVDKIGDCSYCKHLRTSLDVDPCKECNADFHGRYDTVKGNWEWDGKFK